MVFSPIAGSCLDVPFIRARTRLCSGMIVSQSCILRQIPLAAETSVTVYLYVIYNPDGMQPQPGNVSVDHNEFSAKGGSGRLLWTLSDKNKLISSY